MAGEALIVEAARTPVGRRGAPYGLQTGPRAGGMANATVLELV